MTIIYNMYRGILYLARVIGPVTSFLLGVLSWLICVIGLWDRGYGTEIERLGFLFVFLVYLGEGFFLEVLGLGGLKVVSHLIKYGFLLLKGG